MNDQALFQIGICTPHCTAHASGANRRLVNRSSPPTTSGRPIGTSTTGFHVPLKSISKTLVLYALLADPAESTSISFLFNSMALIDRADATLK